MSGAPFRAQDLEARVERLRQERAAVVGELADAQAEMRRLRPWSYRRFILGLFLPFVALGLLTVAMSMASFILR